jgi:hypothetical protein
VRDRFGSVAVPVRAGSFPPHLAGQADLCWLREISVLRQMTVSGPFSERISSECSQDRRRRSRPRITATLAVQDLLLLRLKLGVGQNPRLVQLSELL